MFNLDDCNIIDLPKLFDTRGSLTFIEGKRHVPFDIQRVYYLYDVPNAESRGSHAHWNLFQLVVCVSGSFNIELSDGTRSQCFQMIRPDKGLLITPLIWRELKNFSSGACCVVLASEAYDENDYIRNYEDFLTARNLN